MAIRDVMALTFSRITKRKATETRTTIIRLRAIRTLTPDSKAIAIRCRSSSNTRHSNRVTTLAAMGVNTAGNITGATDGDPRMKLIAISTCLAIALITPTAAHAQWGAALGAGVDQMNRQRSMDLQRQQSEIMQKQLEAQMRMQEIEQRQAQIELEERKQLRIEAQERKEKSEKVNRLFSSAISEYGKEGEEAVANTMANIKPIYDYLTYDVIEQKLQAELKEVLSRWSNREIDRQESLFKEKYPQYKVQKNYDLLGKYAQKLIEEKVKRDGRGYSNFYELMVLSHKRLIAESSKKKQVTKQM